MAYKPIYVSNILWREQFKFIILILASIKAILIYINGYTPMAELRIIACGPAFSETPGTLT